MYPYTSLQDVIPEEWNVHIHRFENLISRLSVSMLYTVLLLDKQTDLISKGRQSRTHIAYWKKGFLNLN